MEWRAREGEGRGGSSAGEKGGREGRKEGRELAIIPYSSILCNKVHRLPFPFCTEAVPEK